MRGPRATQGHTMGEGWGQALPLVAVKHLLGALHTVALGLSGTESGTCAYLHVCVMHHTSRVPC